MKRRRVSVALAYDETTVAPIVVARGEGELADRLVEIARASGVPVTESPELADSLVRLDPETLIPESMYVAVAELLALVWRSSDRQKKGVG